MNPAFRQWTQLPPPERRLLVSLAILQPLASLSLRVSGYKSTLRRIERLTRRASFRQPSASDIAQADRLAELAAIAGRRGPLATTCLRQALVVHGLLRQRGLASVVQLGVARERATPDMHAWVELGGVPLAQPGLRHRAFGPSAQHREP